MLGAMRRHSKSFIIYLLFAMIIIVFVFTFNTGAGKGGGCTPPEVPVYAQVADHTITRDTLVMAMGLLPTYLRTPGGMAFSLASGADAAALYQSDLEEMTPEQANAIMQIVEMIYLASDEALRLGFSIDDKELARAMYPESFYEEEEVTGEDGLPTTKKVFKEKEFQNWIVYGLNTSPQEYEEFISRVLLAFKLQAFMSSLVKVEAGEAEIAARARGAKVDLTYVEFRPDFFAALAEVSDEDATAYAGENAEKIAAYYDGHPTDFHAEAGFQVAGIYVAGKQADPKAEAGEEVLPTPEEMAAAKTRAQEIRDRLDGKKELFKGGKMPLNIDPSQGSIKIDSKDLEIPEEPLARFKEVAKRESDHQASKGRSGLLGGWMTAVELSQPPLGEAVAKALEGAARDALVGPVETADGYWLVYVTDKRDKKDVSLEEATAEIAGRLLRQERAPELVKSKAEEFRKAVAEAEEKDLGKVLEGFKEKLGEKMDKDNLAFMLLQARDTGKFHLATPGYALPGIGKFEELFKDAFTMSLDKPVAEKVYVHPETNRAFVVMLKDREKPGEQIDQSELDMEKENLAFSRSLPYFESWLKALRQSALEKGKMERTEEFNAYLAYLQTRLQEAEEKAAEKAGKTAAK